MKLKFKPKSLIIFILLATITGCYSFIGRYGDSFYEGEDNHYFEKLIDRSLKPENLGSDFTYRLANDQDLRVVDEEQNYFNTCSDSALILRFAWLSDAQIRQKEVKLFNDKVSLNLDNIIPSFEHDPVQEDFDWAVYLSIIAAINQYHKKNPAIDFMIHTGDAIDAGTIEELYHFIYITNKLRVPWLNLVGNHDVAIFGNYQERLGYTRQAAVNFYPVGNQINFITMHGKERLISGFGSHLLPVASDGGHPPSEDGIGEVPITNYHGFDLRVTHSSGPSSANKFDPDDATGYYAFDIDKTPIPIRVIALNSAKLDSWGADGNINDAQREWLRQMIQTSNGRLLLIFAHHRPQEFDQKTMSVLNDPGRGPMVVFTGHTHKHHIKLYTAANGQQFYELNTGSILEYPQIGRLIEIRGEPGGNMCLISRAFWNNYFNLESEIPVGELETYLKSCEENRLDHQKPLSRAARCGNYGAFKDYLNNKNKAWGAPQPLEQALSAANVVIPLTLNK
jgi:predicted phosphodiesterase